MSVVLASEAKGNLGDGEKRQPEALAASRAEIPYRCEIQMEEIKNGGKPKEAAKLCVGKGGLEYSKV